MSNLTNLATVILCGGRGTRAYPHTVEMPKPLLDVDGTPILRHVLDIYAQQGFKRFVLAAGFQSEKIVEYAKSLPADWDVEVVDTGDQTHKGDRVLAVRDLVGDTFMVTYGDGVGNVDIGALLAFHRSHGGLATVTVVPLPSQYGTLEFDDDKRVSRFREKPRLSDHWINAGFLVLSKRAFEGWHGDLESEVLPALGSRGELYAFKHEGFWKSMDTYKDAQDLTALARAGHDDEGALPWLRSQVRASS